MRKFVVKFQTRNDEFIFVIANDKLKDMNKFFLHNNSLGAFKNASLSGTLRKKRLKPVPVEITHV